MRKQSPISKPQIKVLGGHTPAALGKILLPPLILPTGPSMWHMTLSGILSMCRSHRSVYTPTCVQIPSLHENICHPRIVSWPPNSLIFSHISNKVIFRSTGASTYEQGVERHSIHNAIFWIFSAIQWFPVILCWTLCFTSLETYLKAKLAIFLNPYRMWFL